MTWLKYNFDKRQIRRPWGYFRTVYADYGWRVKVLSIHKGKRLSLQSHKHRSETWIVVKGKIVAERRLGGIDGPKFEKEVNTGETFFVGKGDVHRISSESGARLVEVSLGRFSEDDITRFEDDYGRVKA